MCTIEGDIGTSAMSWPTHTRAVEPWKINTTRVMNEVKKDEMEE